MKVKVWKVIKKGTGDSFMIEAPSKRIAKWGAANVYNYTYVSFLTSKDFIAKRYHYMP